ncbi:hypothetical protein DL991_21225 [Amycolatopsis sp. WAC 01375]|uniref:hypothetical protein n=1 Tax=Amycolatopsis sp. WAC 01375 TaxID=2203194 RepID=UPI000F79571A|nr:hypothetical protein [Amycolatopsis sp. WAC 01375]RSM77071.1 hypothetical protein DL991_21225 [Amycolatopsis sp. WAC 01375]
MSNPSDERWSEREQQARRARVLANLLAAAEQAEIPPLRWSVSTAAGSCLHGEIDDPFDKNPHTTFDAWVRFLGLRVNKHGDRASGTWNHTVIGIANPRHSSTTKD